MSKLVIVESPAKAKTIKKYLGGDYEVIASMGHVRDLPKARLCVDVKNDFKPKYAIIKGKEKLVSELKEAAEEADTVYLATDPDREGEAISWHLAYILGLDEDYHNRVTFNEITKTDRCPHRKGQYPAGHRCHQRSGKGCCCADGSGCARSARRRVRYADRHERRRQDGRSPAPPWLR